MDTRTSRLRNRQVVQNRPIKIKQRDKIGSFKFQRRNIFKCPLFGKPEELKKTQLPTYQDMLKCCFQERQNLAPLKGSKEPNFKDIVENVAKKIEKVYLTSSIPIVSHKRVVQMIHTYHKTYKNLMKHYKEREKTSSYQSKIQIFLEKAKTTLFDISACKCVDFIVCTCKKSSKVPVIEQKFLRDQRTTRLMYIGNVDKTTSQVLNKREKRKARAASSLSHFVEDSLERKGSIDLDSESSDTIHSDSDLDSVYEPSSSCQPNQMRVSLPATSKLVDRYRISNRASAAITSAVLQDIGIVSQTEKSFVIDKNKLRREKEKVRVRLQERSCEAVNVPFGLYFDGRRDRTLTQAKIDGKVYRKQRTVEHISLILQPGSEYFGHVTPSSGSASSISKCIISYMSEKEVNVSNVIAVGCDGTNVNTGLKGGVIRILEEKLKKPLQWAICLLHFNELPFRHLFEHLDGKTTGPNSFSGPIGKSLSNCVSLQIANFQKIDFDLPIVTAKDLSTDQKYLLDISKAIQEGQCSIELARRYPGTIAHSRWLTTANRVLRLYVGTEEPSTALKTLVEYILKVYCTGWFSIKQKHSITNGAKHVWDIIQNSRYLPEELIQVIDPVISNNAYFAHPENILLAMLVDARPVIRELAVRRISKGRNSEYSKSQKVRQFKIPTLNFKAQDYSDLIDWSLLSESGLLEPPVVTSFSLHDLRNLLNEDGSISNSKFKRIAEMPCHTQAVERCVKLVTESSKTVCGERNRDGLIRTTLASRASMPSFDNKSKYKMQ